LQSTHSSTLPVTEDLRIAVNYLQIQEVRFKDCFHLHVQIDDVAKAKMLPILTIQCLFENILKHNRLSKSQPIQIWVKSEGQGSLIVTNTRIPLESDLLESTGTGLFNLSERFKLLGGNALDISETQNVFSVRFNLLNA
jgi:LytS/YehU family sensor histidine kinase